MPRALDGHVVTVHHLGLGHELRPARSAEVIHPGAHLKHNSQILYSYLIFSKLFCEVYKNLRDGLERSVSVFQIKTYII